MIHPNFIYLGVALQFFGGIGYLLDTIKGTVKPNRVTWFLWILAPALAFFAQIQQGVGLESLATFIVWFVPLLVFVASFMNKKAEWKIKKLDIYCGLFSLIGLVMWLITKVGNIAIVFSILADALACLPTIVKAWYEPETESAPVFFFGMINAAIGLLIIQTWNFENYAFLAYLLFASTLLTVLIHLKIGRLFAKKRAR